MSETFSKSITPTVRHLRDPVSIKTVLIANNAVSSPECLESSTVIAILNVYRVLRQETLIGTR